MSLSIPPSHPPASTARETGRSRDTAGEKAKANRRTFFEEGEAVYVIRLEDDKDSEIGGAQGQETILRPG